MKKLTLIILSLLLTMSCLASCTGSPDVQDTETDAVTDANDTETEEQTTQEDLEAMELVDFIVRVPADRAPVILQLTDPQIID